ncbi:MAG: winged helix-turn-helix transcriptional regulator [Phycisphaerales bacterium]|nr:winged helix-turn-helix transcriptional regulator [Phycisphaerales bacterium]
MQVALESRLGMEKDYFKLNLAQRLSRSPGCPPKQFPRIQDREKLSRRFFQGLDPDSTSRLLAAVSHPRRIHILKVLLGGPACYRAMAKATGLKAGPLYHHLSELRSAGLIGPKTRDAYVITRKGQRIAFLILAMQKMSSCRRKK